MKAPVEIFFDQRKRAYLNPEGADRPLKSPILHDTLIKAGKYRLQRLPPWCSAWKTLSVKKAASRSSWKSRWWSGTGHRRSRQFPVRGDLVRVSGITIGTVIVVSASLCQAEVSIFADEINAKFARNFEKPVVYYGQSISVAPDPELET